MPRIYDKTDCDEIKALRDQGLTQRKIAEIMGMSRSSVVLILSKPENYQDEVKKKPPSEFFEHDPYYRNL